MMIASYHGHWGPVWCLKSTNNAWIDVGQMKLASIHVFLSLTIAFSGCTRSLASTTVASYHGHWGRVWCLKSTNNAWIDVGQMKFASKYGFLSLTIAFSGCTRSLASTMVASYHGHWGTVWCLKSTNNAWIDVGQIKLASIHGFLS